MEGGWKSRKGSLLLVHSFRFCLGICKSMNFFPTSLSCVVSAAVTASAFAALSLADLRTASAHPIEEGWNAVACDDDGGCRYIKYKWFDGERALLVEDTDFGIFQIMLSCNPMRYKHVDDEDNDWKVIDPGSKGSSLAKAVCNQ